jgi:hypothetical protein
MPQTPICPMLLPYSAAGSLRRLVTEPPDFLPELDVMLGVAQSPDHHALHPRGHRFPNHRPGRGRPPTRTPSETTPQSPTKGIVHAMPPGWPTHSLRSDPTEETANPAGCRDEPPTETSQTQTAPRFLPQTPNHSRVVSTAVPAAHSAAMCTIHLFHNSVRPLFQGGQPVVIQSRPFCNAEFHVHRPPPVRYMHPRSRGITEPTQHTSLTNEARRRQEGDRLSTGNPLLSATGGTDK